MSKVVLMLQERALYIIPQNLKLSQQEAVPEFATLMPVYPVKLAL